MSTATLAPRVRPNLVSNTLQLARRYLLHIKATPEQLVEMTIQPIMFLVLFVFVFGGAIRLVAGVPAVRPPRDPRAGRLLPAVHDGLALNADFTRGVIDQFRSPPIARSAVISGRILADGARIAWSIVIITGFSMILGFSFGGAAGAIAARLRPGLPGDVLADGVPRDHGSDAGVGEHGASC